MAKRPLKSWIPRLPLFVLILFSCISLVAGSDSHSLLYSLRSKPSRILVGKNPSIFETTNDMTLKARSSAPSTISGAPSIMMDTSNGMFFNVSVGTPGQQITVYVDTTLDRTWVLEVNSTKCWTNASALSPSPSVAYGAPPPVICSQGVNIGFSRENSSTLNALGNDTGSYDFYLEYLSGDKFSGAFVSDNLAFQGIVLNSTTFGLVSNFSSSPLEGVFGIGFSDQGLESSGPQVDSILTVLMNNDYTKSRVVSLWGIGGENVTDNSDSSSSNSSSSDDTTSDDDSSFGSVLFGAVDRSKFTGNLTFFSVLSVANENDQTFSFISLESISITNSNGVSGELVSTQLPVLIDSTTLLSYLPYEYIVNIATQINALYNSDLEIWVQSCSYRQINGTIDFGFSANSSISVPLSELLIPVYESNSSEPLRFANGEDVCALAFSASELQGFSSLGTSFIKWSYTIFDIDNRQIGLAQARVNPPSKADITVITNNAASEMSASVYTAASSLNSVFTFSSPNSSFITGTVVTASGGSGVVLPNGGALTSIVVNSLGTATSLPPTITVDGFATSAYTGATASLTSGSSAIQPSNYLLLILALMPFIYF